MLQTSIYVFPVSMVRHLILFSKASSKLLVFMEMNFINMFFCFYGNTFDTLQWEDRVPGCQLESVSSQRAF